MIALPEDRLPPHNLEAEQGVLGAILLDNEVLHDVVPILTAEHFYRDTHQVIYRAIRDLYDPGRPVDLILLAEELTRRGEYGRVGGDEALAAIANGVPHSANAKFHALIVRDKALKREVIESAHELLREGYSDGPTGEELLELAERRILGIGRDDAGETADAIVAVDAALARLETRRAGDFCGVTTGMGDLDETTDGLQPGQLVIVAARPSIGKTALALNVAEHVALDLGRPVLFVSLEMPRVELGDRLLAGRGRVPGHLLRAGQGLSDEHRARLRRVREEVRRALLVIDDAPARTASQIGALARRMKARRGLTLLVVDYAQLIDPGREVSRNASRQEVVAGISRRLKLLAKELAAPVLLLAQLNRESERREDRRPRLSDLRESGALEQDADLVLLLHRPSFYDANDRPGEADLIVAKNRAGRTGTVRLRYEAAFTRFSCPDPLPAGAF